MESKHGLMKFLRFDSLMGMTGDEAWNMIRKFVMQISLVTFLEPCLEQSGLTISSSEQILSFCLDGPGTNQHKSNESWK